MIKTNEWTIADLSKYLVSVRDSLTAEEMLRLKATAAFPMEAIEGANPDAKRTRYKAAQLYEPLDVFRSLGLPVIDWGRQTKWRSSSDEGASISLLNVIPGFLQYNSQVLVRSWAATISFLGEVD